MLFSLYITKPATNVGGKNCQIWVENKGFPSKFCLSVVLAERYRNWGGKNPETRPQTRKDARASLTRSNVSFLWLRVRSNDASHSHVFSRAAFVGVCCLQFHYRTVRTTEIRLGIARRICVSSWSLSDAFSYVNNGLEIVNWVCNYGMWNLKEAY